MPLTVRSTHSLVALALSILVLAGCGTTRSSDTGRTATEQLLISDAIDRAVGELEVHDLAGQSVYLDSQYLESIVDAGYLKSSIRQHLLASGCTLKTNRSDADYVVEARAGAIGTNRHDLLFGIPSMNIPQIVPLPGIPAAIPEVPVAKRRDQRGVAKVAVFAYQRETGLPVWQSGIALQESNLNEVWLLGAGPFQHGTIHRGPAFVSQNLKRKKGSGPEKIALAQRAKFNDPKELLAASKKQAQTDTEVQPAEFTVPVSKPIFAPPKPPASPSGVPALAAPARVASVPVQPATLEPPRPIRTPSIDSIPFEVEQRFSQELLQTDSSIIRGLPEQQQSGWFYSIHNNVQLNARDHGRTIEINPQPLVPHCEGDFIPLPQPIIDAGARQ